MGNILSRSNHTLLLGKDSFDDNHPGEGNTLLCLDSGTLHPGVEDLQEQCGRLPVVGYLLVPDIRHRDILTLTGNNSPQGKIPLFQ
jgi:hypothetical protein